MASGRMHKAGDIHFITNRCEEGRYFLLPTEIINSLVLYWFARALHKFGQGIEIYAFCFLSNHFHLLCRDTKGTLAAFMGYFQGNLARAINCELGRDPAHFWQGHYDDQIVVGEKSFWNKYVYTVTNAVKSGLVRRVEEWVGCNSFKAAVMGERIIGAGLNKTRYHNGNRGKIRRPKTKFMETFEFELSPPPMLEDWSPRERQKEIYRMVKHSEVHYLCRRERKPVLGMARVLSFKPTHRPDRPERRAHRRFACDNVGESMELMERYRSFIHEYKVVFDGFRRCSGMCRRFHGEWPSGSYPPSCHYPVKVGKAA
jgi:REP element-mobilizing transposase RayT